MWILNDVISNMISTHLHLLKVNERIQLLSANLHYASYHPLHFTVHRNTKEGERTSIFKLHYYIIVDTIVWIICEAKQYSEDRDEMRVHCIVTIMKVSPALPPVLCKELCYCGHHLAAECSQSLITLLLASGARKMISNTD